MPALRLIVNRAGASFLAEITALGIPSILIPSPNVTNNHQEANATQLEEQGRRDDLEKDLRQSRLFEAIEKIMNDQTRSQDEWLQASTEARQTGFG